MLALAPAAPSRLEGVQAVYIHRRNASNLPHPPPLARPAQGIFHRSTNAEITKKPLVRVPAVGLEVAAPAVQAGAAPLVA